MVPNYRGVTSLLGITNCISSSNESMILKSLCGHPPTVQMLVNSRFPRH